MLYNEPFVAVFPSLVRELKGDVTAAAVLQHIHFRSQSHEAVEDESGGIWYPVSIEHLADEIGVSFKQARRVTIKLSESGYLKIEKLGGIDRRNYYQVIMEKGKCICPNGHDGTAPNGHDATYPNGAVVLSTNKTKEVFKEYILTDAPESNVSVREKANDAPHGFTEFWKIYPRKVGKADAKKAFIKALKKVDVTELIEGAQRLAADPNLDIKYCPHATSWLNGERWADEAPPVGQPAGPTKATQNARALLELSNRLDGEQFDYGRTEISQ